MGTATYFSPEQAQGLPVDGRSDVYSLGVVLYEMVTGVAPFTGDSPVAVAYKHVREDAVPPSQRNPEIPADLEQIILTALAKDPDHRYQTADDLRADLLRFRRGRPLVGRARHRDRQPRYRRRPAGGLRGDDGHAGASTIAGRAVAARPVSGEEARHRATSRSSRCWRSRPSSAASSTPRRSSATTQEQVAVPERRRQDRRRGDRRARRRGPEGRLSNNEANAVVKAGIVVQPGPGEAATTLERGSTVTLTVSTGRRRRRFRPTSTNQPSPTSARSSSTPGFQVKRTDRSRRHGRHATT